MESHCNTDEERTQPCLPMCIILYPICLPGKICDWMGWTSPTISMVVGGCISFLIQGSAWGTTIHKDSIKPSQKLKTVTIWEIKIGDHKLKQNCSNKQSVNLNNSELVQFAGHRAFDTFRILSPCSGASSSLINKRRPPLTNRG